MSLRTAVSRVLAGCWRVVLFWRRPDTPPVAPVAIGSADGTVAATVHAVLTPDGLVVVDGVVRGAVWCGDSDPPGRGAAVSVAPDPEHDDRWRVLGP